MSILLGILFVWFIVCPVIGIVACMWDGSEPEPTSRTFEDDANEFRALMEKHHG